MKRCYRVGFDVGGRGHEPRNASSLYKLEKGRKLIPSISGRNTTLQHLDFSLVRPISYLLSPELKIINV